MNKQQVRAQARLQLFMIGATHRRLGRFGERATKIITDLAGADGTLSLTAAAEARRQIDDQWNLTFSAYAAQLGVARREAASIPVGSVVDGHRRYLGGIARRAGIRVNEAAGDATGDFDKEQADEVFAPNIKAVLDAAKRRVEGGLNLSQRIWQFGEEARAGINSTILRGVESGQSAWDMAKALTTYLGAGQDCPQWTRTRLYNRTKKEIAAGDRTGLLSGSDCNGRGVAYKALRVARTELQRVHNDATSDMMQRTPWVEEEQINLSPSHPVEDICDEIIAQGRDGKGIYPIGEIQLPIHPNCAPAGEMVTSEFGVTPIEDVFPGMNVLTHGGRMRLVTGTMQRRYTGSMVSIVTVGDVAALMTAEHPVWSVTRQTWVNAADIRWGELVTVLDAAGNAVTDSVRWKGIEPVVNCEVFNISVEDDESYFLGGLLTHNCMCFKTAVQMAPDDFVQNLRGWMRRERQWDAMDRYASTFGAVLWPPMQGPAGSPPPSTRMSSDPLMVDAQADWLDGDELALSARMAVEGDEDL